MTSAAPTSLTSMQIAVSVRGTLLSKGGRKGTFQQVTLSRPFPWPLPPLVSDSQGHLEEGDEELEYLKHLPLNWESTRLSLHHFRESVVLMAEVLAQVVLAPEINAGHIPTIATAEKDETWPLLVKLLQEAASLENQMHENVNSSVEVANKLDVAVTTLNELSGLLSEVIANSEKSDAPELTEDQLSTLERASAQQDAIEELRLNALQLKVARVKNQHRVLENRYCTQVVLMELFAPHVLQRQTWKCLRQTFSERFPKIASGMPRQDSNSIEESNTIIVKAFDNNRETFHAFFPLFNRNGSCRPPAPPPPPLGELADSEPGAVSHVVKPVMSMFHAPFGAKPKVDPNSMDASVDVTAAAAFGEEQGDDNEVDGEDGVMTFVLGQKSRIEVNIPMDVVEACTVQAQSPMPSYVSPPQAGTQEMMTTFKLMEACVGKSRDFSLRDITHRVERVAAIKESRTSGNPIVPPGGLGYTPTPTPGDIKRFEREQRPASIYNFARAFNALLKDIAIKKAKNSAGASGITVEELMSLMDVSMVRAFVGGIHDRIGKAASEDANHDADGPSPTFDGTAALISELNKQSDDEDDFESMSSTSSDDDEAISIEKEKRRERDRLDENFDFQAYQKKLNDDIENDKLKSKEEIDRINKQFLEEMEAKRERRRAKRDLNLRKRKYDPAALTEMRAAVARALDPHGDEKL